MFNLTTEYDQHGHGHFFSKKTFHKPTYCHHCTEMLWGLIGQGCICEVCNFVVHDRCLKQVVSPCSTIASNVIANPMPHCWTDIGHLKRKFCSVCRRRIDPDVNTIRCEVCEYCVHIECSDFAIANCKECATYVPGKDAGKVENKHHWREGNLPSGSKCHSCKKTCWSAECLAGMRCEWCSWTAHPGCIKNLSEKCNFGHLQSIMLPPYCVSIPRTDVPLETILGFQLRKNLATSPRSVFEEQSSVEQRNRELDDYSTSRDKDEEVIKIYDGNASIRKRTFRTIIISRNATRDQLIAASLRTFHIHDDPRYYILTDVYTSADNELSDSNPVASFTRKNGKRPGAMLRFNPPNPNEGSIRVYPGKLNVNDTYQVIQVTNDSNVDEVMAKALRKFGLDSTELDRYRMVEVSVEKGAVHERTMDNQECPWEIVKNLARVSDITYTRPDSHSLHSSLPSKDSVRRKENTRFYIQTEDEVYYSKVAIFVGNLPINLPQKQYENLLIDLLGKPYRFQEIGPIYYEYGSLIITYDKADIAVKAFYKLRDSTYEERKKDEKEDKSLLVLLLPSVFDAHLEPGVRPLLVFVNVKSGGQQGLELINAFRKQLNPYQVYDLENGGPLPGLYVFRNMKNYKILVCGGDGTVGWVLQCLDNVGQDSKCSTPPTAVVPLGTGNDLARVLNWGGGYTGGEDPINLLKDVIQAEEVQLDRWTVIFRSDETKKLQVDQLPSLPSNESSGTSEDNTAICVMNNYFGLGVDADLCLEFHNKREENPERFNSRFHNKGVYVKIGFKKMVSRKSWTELHKVMKLEVDGKVIDIPTYLEGIIILNIWSWGSGANPWGPERDDYHYSLPTHYDGMLEVVGVTGVVHMGQIQSGLKSGQRIAQGGHIKIRINTDMPVQVDGEPWIQSPGEVVILKSALKATMLRKSKIRRRNTEPALASSMDKSSISTDKSSISEKPDRE